MVRRRDFLLGCGGLAAATLVRPLPASAGEATVVPPFSASLRKERFVTLIGQPVHIRRPDGTAVRARVVDVRDGMVARRLEQFSVVLRGPRAVALPAGLYTVQHRTAGSAQLFLQPARADRSSQYYRVNFSLLV